MFLFQATNLGAHRGAVWRIDSWVRSQKMTSTVAPFSIDGEISRSDYFWVRTQKGRARARYVMRKDPRRHMGEELGAPLAAVRGAEPRGGTEPRG